MNIKQERRVLLADSHHAFAEGVRRLLATTFDAVVMVADEVSLFVTVSQLQCDLVVIDLGLAQGDIIDLVRRFKLCCPNTRMIVLSIYDQSSLSRSIIEAGADGFVLKSAVADHLLQAVDAVIDGNQYVSSTKL